VPFVSGNVLELLFSVSAAKDAVVPRWANGYIEPLQAVYRTASAREASIEAVSKGETRMKSMIALLKQVRYVSTIVIQKIDPDLCTFFNVNTLSDLRKAESLMKENCLI
jgi:molybdopterin-guanine dinucleotide biosynthesis protein A